MIRKARLVGDDVSPQATRRLVAAYEDGVAVSDLAKRFSRTVTWVRVTVRMASSSSAMVLV